MIKKVISKVNLGGRKGSPDTNMRYLILTILTIFVVPLGALIKTGQPIWCGQYVGLVFMLFLGISLFLWDYNKPLSILTALCLFSTFFISKMDPRSLLLLLQLDLLCLFSYMVSRIKKEHRKYIMYSLIGFAILQCIWVIVQSLNIDPIFNLLKDSTKDDLVGFSGSHGQLGAFFGMTAPLFVSIHPLLFIIPLVICGVIKSSFGILAASISGLLYLYFKNKRYFKAFLAIILICGMGFMLKTDRRPDFTSRLGVWKYASKAVIKGKMQLEDIVNAHNKAYVTGRELKTREITCNPLLGYGFGSFLVIFPFVPVDLNMCYNYNDELFTHAHNDYVEFFFETGILGALALGLLLFMFFKGFNREGILYFSCIVGYLVNALGNFPSHIAVSGMFLAVFYGLYRGVCNVKTR